MIDTTNMGIMASMIQPTSTNMSSHMISQKDSDSDSALSIDEMGVSENIFSSYDTDSDGLVSQSELTTAIDTAMSQFDGEMPSKEEFQSILADFGFEAQSSTTSSGLSSSQLDTISSVLSDYDAENLTESDAQAIVSAFKEAGIEPSEELVSAMDDAGFDAQEVGTLAGVGPQGQAGMSGMMGPPPSGGQGGGMSSSDVEEVFDALDTNEDGTVSLEELQEYYGTSTETDSSTELSANQQNALDNLKLLMETIKSSSSDDSVDTNSFDGLLKTINTQNNNSNINTYLQNSTTSSLFGYA